MNTIQNKNPERSFSSHLLFQNKHYTATSKNNALYATESTNIPSIAKITRLKSSSTPRIKEKIYCFGFLLLPGFSSINLASAVHVLNIANNTQEKKLYDWKVFSKTGEDVPTYDGLKIHINESIESFNISELDALVVCGGSHNKIQDSDLIHWIKKTAALGIDIGSISSGIHLLASAGLLNGYQCTTHWEFLSSMQEQFPHLNFSSKLFAIDRKRFSCSGGSSVLDLMVHLTAKNHGKDLALAISESLLCERIRDPEELQRSPLVSKLSVTQPKLSSAITLMESNVEETLSIEEIAGYIGCSKRHFERLFKMHMHCTPSRYYIEIRLTKARQLLWQTNETITQIALACGFISAPHFSRCYKEFFGESPRSNRNHLI